MASRSMGPASTFIEATTDDSGGGPGGDPIESRSVGAASTAEEPVDLPRVSNDDRISMKSPEDGELFTEEAKPIKPKK